MKVKTLFSDVYRILATDGGEGDWPAEQFLEAVDNYEKSRIGLQQMLEHVSERGLDGVPAKWSHEANKKLKVLEFIKGDLRLFFFKGEGRDIAVCTGGALKKGQKADGSSVARAAALRVAYFEAIELGQLEVIEDGQDQ